MPNFFYFDKNGTKQSFNEQQLQALAAQGRITPQTLLESDTGYTGTAGQIPGLNFNVPPAAPSQPVAQAAAPYGGGAVPSHSGATPPPDYT